MSLDGSQAHPDHKERTEQKQADGENQTQMPGRYRPETKRTEGNVEILSHVLALQSMLSQLDNPVVRSYLVANWGLPVTIEQIDQLRETLFPHWTGGTLRVAAQRRLSSVQHLNSIFSRSDAPFVLEGTILHEMQSYNMWYRILSSLASLNIWNHVGSLEKADYDNVLDVKESKNAYGQIQGKLETPNRKLSEKSGTRPSSRNHSRYKMKPKIEEFVVLTSSDSSHSDSDADEEVYVSSRKKSSCRVSSSIRSSTKEVVTPPMFELDGKMHLKEFFVIYEDYFDRKFDGSEFDKTQELGKFLHGPLAEVFEIKGGRRLPYSVMKKELLYWYKQEKIGSKSYWRMQFDQCRPKSLESLDLYGMRLVELAQMAFPESPSSCARKLHHHFLASIPTAISSKIQDAERTLQMDPSRKIKHMAFSSITQMARDLQKQSSQLMEPKSICFAGIGETLKTSHPFPVNEHGSRPKTQKPRKIYNNSKFKNNEPMKYQVVSCTFCGKRNHSAANCWLAMNLCPLCGNDHEKEECPKFRKTDTRRRPVCNYCQGNHLDVNCKERSDPLN